MQHDDDSASSLDRALYDAAKDLLKEIRAEPVPQSIVKLANHLQAVLDQKLKVEVMPQQSPGDHG